jgi:hypothetical protein
VILGALFLAEAVTLNVVLGTLVVFVGIALTQQRLPLPGRRASRAADAASVSPVAPEGLVRGEPDHTGRNDAMDAVGRRTGTNVER